MFRGEALLLVGVASFAHALWNLLSKQAARAAGSEFVWLVAVLGSAVYAPLVIGYLIVSPPRLGWPQLVFLVGTAVLHTTYYVLLQRGYRLGDLSVVYPIARGTGPLLSSLVAIWLYAERPGAFRLAGILLITLGVLAFGLPSGAARAKPVAAGVGYGLATGVLIASYTLWDKYTVADLAVPALFVSWTADFGRALLLAPVGLRRRTELGMVWRDYRMQVLGTAILAPLSYLLVLIALRMAPVSVVAPAREVSVLLGVLLGGTLLAEGQLVRRLPAATAIIGGITLLALS